MTEMWREINSDYAVSSHGRVSSRRKSGAPRIMKPDRRGGYLSVWLCSDNGRTRRPVHRLVAELFLPPQPTPRHEINHRNGIKTDNRSDNLEWVTPSENAHHRYDILGQKAQRGEAHSQARLTEMQVIEIRARCSSGEYQRIVAADFSISRQAVNKIANSKRWTHVP